MKKLLPILYLIILINSCSSQPTAEVTDVINCTEQSGFKICQDTLKLNVPGFITSGALYHENYYLFFQDLNDRDKLGNQNPDKLYRVSKDGSKIKEIKYPEEFTSIGCNFMIRNDSLIAYTQWEHETYSLNTKNLKWTKTTDSPPIIYEDAKFKVSSICHGEFGGIVTFYDKENGNTYDEQSTCALTVNKLNNKYFVTNFLGHMMSWSEIVQISNPRKLHKRDENPENDWYKYNSKLNKGSKSLLDTTNIAIHSSFILSNDLYHIYSNDSICFIGKLNNGGLSKELTLKFFPSLQHKLNNNDQFLTFYSKKRFFLKDEFEFGILEIINGELRIHYIENRRPKMVSKDSTKISLRNDHKSERK